MGQNNPVTLDIQNWFNLGIANNLIEKNFCQNRSDFNGRLSSYEPILKKSFQENCLYLFISSIGEVGNNCFDHNLGYWQSSAGCFFLREEKYCIIADRGQGIRNSLSKVVDLTGKNSIEYAFHNVVSGRAPEKRGNGLKHVRRSLVSCKISISVYSGNEYFGLGEKTLPHLPLNNQGVFVLFNWD